MTPGRNLRIPDGRWRAAADLAAQLDTNREALINRMIEHAIKAGPAEVAAWLGMEQAPGGRAGGLENVARR